MMNSKLIVIVLILVLLTTLHESDAWRRRRRAGLLHKKSKNPLPMRKEDAKPKHTDDRKYEDEIMEDLMKELDQTDL
ncbi:hypothetical protein AC249_AIPGENE19529 [Exaiptasia diaphana]|nr:hypothetical protein AC249_AIPGENE19529 [Exaiptasia diaphana]